VENPRKKCCYLARATVPPLPERVDITIAAHGAPGAKTVQSRTNQGFPVGPNHSPQRGVARPRRHSKLLIL
jgi:hypothetical protein